MIYREGIAFCCENRTECITVLRGKNREILTLNLLYTLTNRSYRVNAGWLVFHKYAQAKEPF